MAKTLFEYYKSRGQALPGIKERSKTFEELGLGSGEGYKGTAEQNIALLKRLETIPPTPAPKPPVVLAGAQGATQGAQNLPVSAPGEPRSTISTPSIPVADRYEKLLGELETAFKNIPSKTKLYTEELTTRNIEPQRQQLRSLDERIAEMEKAIGESEEDIRKRTIQSGGLVTESQTQRLVAAEKEPLIRSYKNLLDERNRLAQQVGEEETRAGTIAGLKYEEGLQPLESLKTRLGIEKDISELTRGGKPIEVGGNLVQYNPQTGKYEMMFEKPTSDLDLMKLELSRERLEVAKEQARSAQERAQLQSEINNIKLQQLIAGGGLTAEERSKLKEAFTTFTSADSMLGSIESLAKKVITAKSPQDIPAQYLAGSLGAITKFNPDAAVFRDTINAFSSMLTRAAGEKGVLTTQDVQRIINALPKLTDTSEVALRKLQQLRTLYENIKEGAIKAYSTPIPTLLGGEPAAGGQSNDPLGIR